ncbi:hypothetical protein ACP4OV_003629 [Aristida adscensionis]
MVEMRSVKSEQGELFLPPGFRFHPTDEEVITSYLLQKLLNPSFAPRAVGEVDLNKCEPWDLPSKAKMGEKEWYFFCHKDMKYPTGMRTNRATKEGYWKATGKDREIFKDSTSAHGGGGRELVGMKKTLVFYTGRAPRGAKTNWVMHEFRLHGNLRRHSPKDEWVVCKVFHKNGEAKKGGGGGGVEYSAGTPNVSSVSVDAGAGAGEVDEFLDLDSLIDPVSYFNSTGSSATTTIDAAMAAPYNVEDYYYHPISSTAAATASSFADLPSYSFNDTITNSATVPRNSSGGYSSSWKKDTPHAGYAMGSTSSYSLHHQAMMAKAAPNFAAAGLPSSSPTGALLQNSPLATQQQKLGNYVDVAASCLGTTTSNAAAALAASVGPAAKTSDAGVVRY